MRAFPGTQNLPAGVGVTCGRGGGGSPRGGAATFPGWLPVGLVSEIWLVTIVDPTGQINQKPTFILPLSLRFKFAINFPGFLR
jgi:hypothetical protein